MKRADAARIGGMDRQTLRDWVHRFNKAGPNGLRDAWASGPTPRLSVAQKAQLADIVEAGSDREVDGGVRWRRIDLKRIIAARFGVDYHERYVGTSRHRVWWPIRRRVRCASEGLLPGGGLDPYQTSIR